VLPPIALRFLEVLMKNSPRVISREEVERAIWGETPPDSDALRGHLHIMRNVVDKNSDKPLIKTHRALGYQISDE
jgi:DNA-binding response OmpR family regulator